jgi:hypothetical protein
VSERRTLNLDALPELVTAARNVGVPLDGHTIGMIGEAHAAALLDLTLMRNSNAGYDATDADGRTVEIKATTRRSFGLRVSDLLPALVVLLTLDGDTLQPTIVYYGPAEPVWAAAGKPQRNGQRQISVRRVREMPAG